MANISRVRSLGGSLTLAEREEAIDWRKIAFPPAEPEERTEWNVPTGRFFLEGRQAHLHVENFVPISLGFLQDIEYILGPALITIDSGSDDEMNFKLIAIWSRWPNSYERQALAEWEKAHQ